MRQKAPGRGVALRRKEVAPVLPDEPSAEQGRSFRAVCQVPEFRDSADEKYGEYGQPQCELVDAESAEIDARTQSMPFQA